MTYLPNSDILVTVYSCSLESILSKLDFWLRVFQPHPNNYP